VYHLASNASSPPDHRVLIIGKSRKLRMGMDIKKSRGWHSIAFSVKLS